MSDINKRIHENAAKLAKVKVGGCGTCEGLGCISDKGICDICSGERNEMCGGYSQCPTCATLRKVAEYHCHEWVIGGDPAYPDKGCTICNGWKRNDGIDNPIYTVQTMRTLLEELGEWEGWGNQLQFHGKVGLMNMLTSDPDMRQAVVAYLEHRVREVA